MSQNTTNRVTQIDYMRSYLKDPAGDGQLFTDLEYETFLWQTVTYQQTLSISARKHDDERPLWTFFYVTRGLGDVWRVTVDTPMGAQSDYQINEPARMVFQPEGGDTSDPLKLHATIVNVRDAMSEAMIAASNSPAKVAVYMQANGLVMDTRQAADNLYAAGLRIRGIH